MPFSKMKTNIIKKFTKKHTLSDRKEEDPEVNLQILSQILLWKWMQIKRKNINNCFRNNFRIKKIKKIIHK